MTDTVSLPSLSLSDQLTAWLRDPVIRLEMMPSQEVAALQIQVRDLQDQLRKCQHDNEVLMARYSNELNLNLILQDILKDHGIKWR